MILFHSQDSFGSTTSIKSLKRKNMPSNIKKIFFASVPERSSLEESNIPKSPSRSTNVETNPETDFLYSCLKFPNLKGSGTTAEGSKDSLEQVSLGDILSIIEPVSKQMEKDKKTKAEPFRFFDASVATSPQSLLSNPVIYDMPYVKEDQKGKLYYEWRGIVSEKYHTRYLFKAGWFNISRQLLYQEYLNNIPKRQEKKKTSKAEDNRIKSNSYYSDVERIGPHLDIYLAFQPQLRKRKDKMSKKILKAIILIQGAIRGWLERRRLARVIAKAADHGPNFRAVVNAYRRMIDRIQRRAGLRNARVILQLSELEEWLDRKKFYEVMFAKREYFQGIPKNDLPKYFRDCGHFPTKSYIDSTYLLVQKYNEIHSEEVKKAKAIEMIFTLYPPEGAHVSHFWGLKSTWTRPIVRGEEAYKYLVSGHPIIKKADIRIVGKLVARSMRERRMKIRFRSPE
ncbi:IQ domain-containing protein M [Petaurus breviceps papuanus]|uniref:IQ domain-containing protein M n=1 Tax=Petaurus breviceps papuanus TaxID=3040969 RepID=UPI0036DDF68C